MCVCTHTHTHTHTHVHIIYIYIHTHTNTNILYIHTQHTLDSYHILQAAEKFHKGAETNFTAEVSLVQNLKDYLQALADNAYVHVWGGCLWVWVCGCGYGYGCVYDLDVSISLSIHESIRGYI
jgi:hypothetical protein